MEAKKEFKTQVWCRFIQVITTTDSAPSPPVQHLIHLVCLLLHPHYLLPGLLHMLGSLLQHLLLLLPGARASPGSGAEAGTEAGSRAGVRLEDIQERKQVQE